MDPKGVKMKKSGETLCKLGSKRQGIITDNLTIDKSSFVSYKKDLITKDYSMGKPLGSGSFGTVRIATHKLTQQKRAIKVIKKGDQDEQTFFLEVNILSNLTHPNIMQIYEFYDDEKNFYIVSEVCSGGELFEKISEQGTFTESAASSIIKQILSAISYSHTHNVVHRYNLNNF